MTNDIALDIKYLPRMPEDKSPGIGCVGSGFIMADCHLVSYAQAGFNPVAITSIDPEQLRDAAERHGIPNFYDNLNDMLENKDVQIVDIAVPPDAIIEVVREVVKHDHIRGILSQKPMGCDYQQAKEIVTLCESAGIKLAVNQNMRYDQSIRACRDMIDRGYLGDCVLGTIDMRAIPHWMPWQERLGFVTLRTMSIHHLDCFRYLFGDPVSVYASIRKDPRTMQSFDHEDGICLYIIEWENGLRASSWDDVWFPDAFAGPMASLLRALETESEPEVSGRNNLGTMALVDACYLSAKVHRPVDIAEIEA